ncbi:MAG: hypothetical protein C5S44_06340 [Candidatus Methanocomedens sp.]|nr:MAG: hypothetical protein C5S44_06340 [ANME-2 cluster archaeon]
MGPKIQAAVEFVEQAGSGRLCAGLRVWWRHWRGEAGYRYYSPTF